MKLTDNYDVMSDTFEFEGEEVAVDLSFDVVLKVLELLASDEFDVSFKIDRTLSLLVPEFEYWGYDFEVQYELFVYLVETFLAEKLVDDGEDGLDDGPSVKTMDFDKDADLIFVSFYHAYGIDLFEMQGKLHWTKFRSLLNHLPGETAFKEVVNYRVMKIPSKNEASDDYIAHVKKMKRRYSLESDEEIQQSNDDKLSAFAAQFGGG